MDQVLDETQTELDFDVYQFDGFIAALNGFLDHKKRFNPTNWSMGAWSKRLNLANTASLSNILSERKSVSRELGKTIIESMRLDERSSEYLELLLELLLVGTSHPIVIDSLRRRAQLLKSLSTMQIPEKKAIETAQPLMKLNPKDYSTVMAAITDFQNELLELYGKQATGEDFYQLEVKLSPLAQQN